MAIVPLRFCAHPQCSERVSHGRCAKHRREQDQERGSARARGYTRSWDTAAQAFRRLHPLCGMRPGGQAPVMSRCHEEGRTTAATCVDHVVPHKGDQALFWDHRGNWQALCDECHSRKTQAGL